LSRYSVELARVHILAHRIYLKKYRQICQNIVFPKKKKDDNFDDGEVEEKNI